MKNITLLLLLSFASCITGASAQSLRIPTDSVQELLSSESKASRVLASLSAGEIKENSAEAVNCLKNNKTKYFQGNSKLGVPALRVRFVFVKNIPFDLKRNNFVNEGEIVVVKSLESGEEFFCSSKNEYCVSSTFRNILHEKKFSSDLYLKEAFRVLFELRILT